MTKARDLASIPAGSGDFSLTGDLVFASGQGIDFSATGNGSGTMSSELFDDYEEGSFTPIFNNVAAPTYTTQNGRYTKIGNVVYFEIEVIYSSLDTADASALAFTGLPFVVDDSYRGIAHLIPNRNGYTGGGKDNVAFAITSTGELNAYGMGSSPNTFDYSSGNWAASGVISAAGWYIATS